MVRDPRLSERLVHGNIGTVFDPGHDGAGRRVGERNRATFVAGFLAQSDDLLGDGRLAGTTSLGEKMVKLEIDDVSTGREF